MIRTCSNGHLEMGLGYNGPMGSDYNYAVFKLLQLAPQFSSCKMGREVALLRLANYIVCRIVGYCGRYYVRRSFLF